MLQWHCRVLLTGLQLCLQNAIYILGELSADAFPSRLQISQLEFSRDRKMMSVRCRRQDQDTLFVKGAPEAVMARCTRVSHKDRLQK